MKKLFLFLVIPFFTMMGSERHTGEFVITLTNYGSSWDVTFTATAVSEKWDGNYHLTDSYNSASDRVSSPSSTAYFDLVIDPNAGQNPTMALGKYKITASVNGDEKAHFYMDWRTSDYGVSPDVYFKYDVNNERFRNSNDTQTIDGTTQTVWNLVSGIDKVTSGLELYLDVSEQNDHPNLSWNAYHDSNILGYNIYKKVTLDGGSSSTFTIFTTSTSYLDDDFEIDPKFGNDQVEYWVKAKISSSQESLNGNHVKQVGTSFIQWKKTSQGSNNKITYFLEQNYPNPFNPSTVINYQLKNDDHVKIVVYNSIGETVAELVNEKQAKGKHMITFNAASLPSGIYLYKLETTTYTDTKKMLLIR